MAAATITQSMLINYIGTPRSLFATRKDRFTKDLLAFLRGWISKREEFSVGIFDALDVS
jgi:hypothetical protein